MSLEHELTVALDLARKAGAVLLQFYSGVTGVEWKDEREPVTAADRAANSLIVEEIARLFPDDGVLAEESPDTTGRLRHDRLWVIDPMDGTKEFILTSSIVAWETEPGKIVKAWTYNGVVPAPMIKVDVGDKVRIVLHNELPESTTIHFHGVRVPNSMDGVPPYT